MYSRDENLTNKKKATIQKWNTLFMMQSLFGSLELEQPIQQDHVKGKKQKIKLVKVLKNTIEKYNPLIHTDFDESQIEEITQNALYLRIRRAKGGDKHTKVTSGARRAKAKTAQGLTAVHQEGVGESKIEKNTESAKLRRSAKRFKVLKKTAEIYDPVKHSEVEQSEIELISYDAWRKRISRAKNSDRTTNNLQEKAKRRKINCKKDFQDISQLHAPDIDTQVQATEIIAEQHNSNEAGFNDPVTNHIEVSILDTGENDYIFAENHNVDDDIHFVFDDSACSFLEENTFEQDSEVLFNLLNNEDNEFSNSQSLDNDLSHFEFLDDYPLNTSLEQTQGYDPRMFASTATSSKRKLSDDDSQMSHTKKYKQP